MEDDFYKTVLEHVAQSSQFMTETKKRLDKIDEKLEGVNLKEMRKTLDAHSTSIAMANGALIVISGVGSVIGSFFVYKAFQAWELLIRVAASLPR